MSLLPSKRNRGEGEYGLQDLRDEMNRLFDSFWRGDWSLEPMREWGRFGLDVDVVEDESSIKVKADVQGMDPKELDISVSDNMLTIKGQKSEEREDKEKNYYRSERRYGSFTRTIVLPASVDAGKITAEVKKGVLCVTLPKTEVEKPKKIEVKGEAEEGKK